MQRFVGKLGWSLAFLALASCSSGSTGKQQGTGGHAGGSGGSGGSSGGSVGTGGGTGGQSTGGTTGTGGSTGGSGGSVDTGSGGGGSGGGNKDASAPETGGGDAANDTGGGGDWVILFNGIDLTGWIPSPGAAPLYAVETKDSSQVIHVYPTQPDQSNQPQATLRTTKSYSSYIFHEEYKWGTKRFGARAQTTRDNGICFHICEATGKASDLDQVWPESIEFQIGSTPWDGPGTTAGGNIDWVVGNIFMLVNKTRAQWTYKTASGMDVYSPTGMMKMIGGPTTSYYRALTDKNRNIDDDWNILELTVHADKDATYTVNGEVANKLTNMECQVNGTWQPLTSGPIGLQAEFAEVFFRNIMIKVLP